jgi:hypothetical protein
MTNIANTKQLQRIANAAMTKADALSLTLHNLTEIVRLAAFAAESRRTLEGIKNAMHFRPEMQEVIDGAVPYASNWLEMEDTTGEVLRYTADQLEEVKSEFTESLYDLARAMPTGTDAADHE